MMHAFVRSLASWAAAQEKAQHEKQHQRSLYHALLFHDFFHLYALMTSRFHIDLKRC